MSGGVDAPLPFNDESGHIIGQKEEGYFNLYSEKYKIVPLLINVCIRTQLQVLVILCNGLLTPGHYNDIQTTKSVLEHKLPSPNSTCILTEQCYHCFY